jgi:hypothetical protein
MKEPELDVRYDEWHAVHDHPRKTLSVYGSCTIRSGGVAVSLEERKEQGINPRMLMLDLRFTPTGESPSEQKLRYEQRWDDRGIQYDEVGFVVEGPVEAPGPPSLLIEDVS